MGSKKEKRTYEHCLHKLITLIIYVVAFSVSYYILKFSYQDENVSLILIISSGAILATFGSALSAISCVWEKDLLDKVLTNIDILFVDILKQEKWRRWPFLPRSSSIKQLDGSNLIQNLKNPELPLNVGTHHIKVDIPTVFEDFFDLPVIKNTYKIVRFRIAASTTLLKGKDVQVTTATGLDGSDEYMAYECLYSVWISVFKFRALRYLIHFGSSLTIFGALNTLYYVLQLNV